MITEEQHGNPRWWLSPEGDFISCNDHEFWARHRLQREDPTYRYAGVVDTYRRIMGSGWVRVVLEPDQIIFDRKGDMKRAQLSALRDLSIERSLPLFDAQAMRVIECADKVISALLDP